MPWLFLAPALILFLYFKFIPMAQALVMSVQEVQPYLGNLWVGAANYSEILGVGGFRGGGLEHRRAGRRADVRVDGARVRACPAGGGAGPGTSFVRSAAFLPVVVPIAVVAELWRIMYHPTADGLMNQVIGLVGLGPSGFINDPGHVARVDRRRPGSGAGRRTT